MHYKMNSSFGVIEFYGITQDPETENYIMVLDYAKNGSLRNYLDKNYHELSWNNKISYLYFIIFSLANVHKNELFHRDLHIGNILHESVQNIYITDMGLCKPADYHKSENTKNSIY